MQVTLGIVGGILFAVVAYFFMSFSTLQPTEAGIDFNMLTYTLGDTYGPKGNADHWLGGRHWLGLGHSFIKFPMIVQTIEFISHDSDFKKGGLLRSRTSDGLEVLLEVSMQYQLSQDNVAAIYGRFAQNYEPVYAMLAIDTISREATMFDAATFFSKRSDVESGLKTELQKVFVEQALCELKFFQLRSVSLPTLFETAIQNTTVRQQDILTAKAEAQHNEVSGATTVFVATERAKAIGQAAVAAATTVQLFVDAYVEAFNLSQGLQSTAFAGLHETLGKNQESLVEYMVVRALSQHPPEKSIVNIQMPSGMP